MRKFLVSYDTNTNDANEQSDFEKLDIKNQRMSWVKNGVCWIIFDYFPLIWLMINDTNNKNFKKYKYFWICILHHIFRRYVCVINVKTLRENTNLFWKAKYLYFGESSAAKNYFSVEKIRRKYPFKLFSNMTIWYFFWFW